MPAPRVPHPPLPLHSSSSSFLRHSFKKSWIKTWKNSFNFLSLLLIRHILPLSEREREKIRIRRGLVNFFFPRVTSNEEVTHRTTKKKLVSTPLMPYPPPDRRKEEREMMKEERKRVDYRYNFYPAQLFPMQLRWVGPLSARLNTSRF